MLWGGDTRVKLLANLSAYGGDVGLLTVTAPGAEVLAWDGSGCAWRGEHEHSGSLGCVVEEEAAHEWNGMAPGRWRALHREAMRIARREAKRSGLCLDELGKCWWTMLARAWEWQKRGALHVHVIVPMATYAEALVSRFYADALAVLAPSYGFGYVDLGRRQPGQRARVLQKLSRERAARYIGKYLAPIDPGTGKITLTDAVLRRDVPGHVVHVARSLTRETRYTMRTLRVRRRVWWQFALAADGNEDDAELRLAVLLLRLTFSARFGELPDYMVVWLSMIGAPT